MPSRRGPESDAGRSGVSGASYARSDASGYPRSHATGRSVPSKTHSKATSDGRWSIDTPHEPRSRMALDAIPGYAGYVPGVYAGNLHGTVWRRTNKNAANDLAPRADKVVLDKSTHLPGASEKVRPSTRMDSSMRPTPSYPGGAEIPRYAGFIPGIDAGNLISTCTPRAAKNNWCHVTHGTSLEKIGHRGAHGGHLDKIGH